MNHALDLMTPAELDQLPPGPDAGFGSLKTERGHLPLEAMDVRARTLGLDLNLTLRQTFVNTLEQPLEATYIFPLPDRAAVTGFRLRVGERVVDGVIDERGRARASYDQALRDGHRAAIAEEERPDVFTVRVGNLMPGQRAAVELDLVGVLSLERNEASFRFPLVVAPRYIPGSPLDGTQVGSGWASDTDAVPDASRITPPVLLSGYPSPVRLSLRVDLDPAGLPVSNLRSSLHAVTVTEGPGQAQPGSGGDRRTIELAADQRLDRDFVLRWSLGDGAVRTALSVALDDQPSSGSARASDGDGARAVVDPDAGTAGHDRPGASFALTVLPPLTPAGGDRPRDVVVVLDRSGSMGGWKMVVARRTAARLIDSLDRADRFAVLAFDNRIDTASDLPADQLASGTDRHRFRAVEFLAGIDARGGTEMAAPLLRAAELLGGGYRDRERVLVLVTDGQVGNEDQILRLLAPRLGGVRVFPIGIDRAVNAGFLDRLADLGGGAAELVESEDRLDEVMERIRRSIGTPVVTELSLEGDGIDLEPGSVTPRRLPDLLAGAPVVLRGRLRGPVSDRGALVVRGADRAGSSWTMRVALRRSTGGAEPALWARAMIRQLEDRYASGERGLAARIVELSRRFSVLSRFTAFLAVDRSEVVNPGGERHAVVQAVEPASGWDMLASTAGPTGIAAPMTMAMPMPAAAPASQHELSRCEAPRPAPPAEPQRASDLVLGTVHPARGPAQGMDARRAAPPAAPDPLLVALRRARDHARAGAQLHPAVVADTVVREIEPVADRLVAGPDWLAQVERVRRALCLLLESAAGTGQIERRLAELLAALDQAIARLERPVGPATGDRQDRFWR